MEGISVTKRTSVVLRLLRRSRDRDVRRVSDRDRWEQTLVSCSSRVRRRVNCPDKPEMKIYTGSRIWIQNFSTIKLEVEETIIRLKKKNFWTHLSPHVKTGSEGGNSGELETRVDWSEPEQGVVDCNCFWKVEEGSLESPPYLLCRSIQWMRPQSIGSDFTRGRPRLDVRWAVVNNSSKGGPSTVTRLSSFLFMERVLVRMENMLQWGADNNKR